MKYTFQILKKNQITKSNNKLNKQISKEILRKNLIQKSFSTLKVMYMKRKTKNVL